jgi:hypothetical protein
MTTPRLDNLINDRAGQPIPVDTAAVSLHATKTLPKVGYEAARNNDYLAMVFTVRMRRPEPREDAGTAPGN